MFFQVIARYVFDAPPFWTEELARFTLIWITFVGAGLVHQRGEHIAVNSFRDTLPRTPRFLAKSTLWHNPLLRPLLALCGAVPVFRRQDVGADTSANGTVAWITHMPPGSMSWPAICPRLLGRSRWMSPM